MGMAIFALFSSGEKGEKEGKLWGSACPGRGGPSSPVHLLLIGGALLGSRVVQADVLLAGSPADHPEALSPTAAVKLPLLEALGGVTWLGEVLPKRKEKQMAQQTGVATSNYHLTACLLTN